MPKPLTDLERDVLDYLVDYVRQHTYQPSIREIGGQFDIKSTKTVSELLHSLADKGWIERDSARSRGVRLLGLRLDADVVSVPHIDVHLSDPTLDDPLDSLTLDRRIAGSAGSFMVSMVGDGMREEGIRDGDLVLVEPVQQAALNDGDLVLCRLEEETSVRRIQIGDGETLLVSPGLEVPPALLDGAGESQVLGRVVAVIRRLRTDTPVQSQPSEATGEGVAAG
jgi:repressor LexA